MICKLLKNIYDNNLHSKLDNDELQEQNYVIGLQLIMFYKLLKVWLLKNWNECTHVGKYNTNRLDFYHHDKILFTVHPANKCSMTTNIHMYSNIFLITIFKNKYMKRLISKSMGLLIRSKQIPLILKDNLNSRYYEDDIKINVVVRSSKNITKYNPIITEYIK